MSFGNNLWKRHRTAGTDRTDSTDGIDGTHRKEGTDRTERICRKNMIDI